MNDDPTIQTGAISVYGPGNAMDDFPVLKAFQQYIDAEQAKARKRLLALGVFFGVLMGAVIAVFVAMLMSVTARNQQLNDRLIEFAMQERRQPQQAAVVVQPPVQQDNSALMAVTSKLEELGKQLADKEKAVRIAREEAAKAKAAVNARPKGPTAQDLEIANLKAQLAAEKEKLKTAELEAYRRKHYPELYADRTAGTEAEAPRKPARTGETSAKTAPPENVRKRPDTAAEDRIDDVLEVLEELDDDAAIDYFSPSRPAKKKKRAKREDKKPENDYYSIPVDIKGTKSNWVVPED